MSDSNSMTPENQARAARLCELMDEYLCNRTAAEKDRQMQTWIAQSMTQEQRCAALVLLMDFAITCWQRQAEAAGEQSVR